MLEAEMPGATLLSWRITSLPLTEEEADVWWDEEWENQELGAAEMNEQGIDMSALKNRDEPPEGRRYPSPSAVRAKAATS